MFIGSDHLKPPVVDPFYLPQNGDCRWFNLMNFRLRAEGFCSLLVLRNELSRIREVFRKTISAPSWELLLDQISTDRELDAD